MVIKDRAHQHEKGGPERDKKQDKITSEFALTQNQWSELVDSYLRHDQMKPPIFFAIVKQIHKKWLRVVISPPTEGAEAERSHVHLSCSSELVAFVSGRYLQKKRTSTHFVAVGDVVVCQGNPSSDQGPFAVICRKPRTNTLYRRHPFYKDRRQVIGANVNQILMVSSVISPPISWHLIDHYLVYAEIYKLDVMIVITKKDRLGELVHDELVQIIDRLKVYESLGYSICFLSAVGSSPPADSYAHLSADHQHFFLQNDAQIIKQASIGRISLLSGASGVGKSSLVNHVLHGQEWTKVGTSEGFGRHTTSSSRLIKIAGESHCSHDQHSFVMDTPGIKSFPIDSGYRDVISWGYREFQPFLGQCRFASCSHDHEPGCAIKNACEQGIITPWRYRSYLRLINRC